MSIHVALRHRTTYRYDRPAQLSAQVVRLRPAPHCRTRILSYSLKVTPGEHFLNWQQDPFSNHLARLVFPAKTQVFEAVVDLIADMRVINPFDFFLDEEAREFPFGYPPALKHELEPFLKAPPPGPLLREYLGGILREPQGTITFLMDLNQRLQRHIEYVIRLEPGVQTSEETLSLRRGSCRDSAWLLAEILRNLGLAARFVSGYLIQLTPDVRPLDGPAGPAADFTDLHAWTEVYLPGAGWIGLDPTSGLAAGEGHIPLACSPEASSAAPISGSVEHCEVEFEHEMCVQRIHEAPRVTKPYTEEAWKAIDALGHRVDAALHTADVRLTMGGEPTFVAVDARDAPEWHTEALGAHKWECALDLFGRLKDRFAVCPLPHHGMGKWYPGEHLPRWSLDCYWRKDGRAIWRDPAWNADPRIDYGFHLAEANRFAHALAERLGVASGYVIPGFEDVYYHIWRERRLPVNVDVRQSRIKDPIERERIARIFEKGLGMPVGYALPLRRVREGSAARWHTGPWFFRAEQMFLVPGDSPMGFRLPLDSIPWAAEGDAPGIHPPDPMSALPPLPMFFEEDGEALEQLPLRQVVGGTSGGMAVRARLQPPGRGPDSAGRSRSAVWRQRPTAPIGESDVQPGQPAPNTIRTALCVQPRDGRLYVFMPPVAQTEDYLDLVAAIEDTAEYLRLPVLIEGYKPPSDHRLHHFSVTPDPGVIEVNIQPAHSWEELARNTSLLYDAAHESRLCTEKFMLDGRHTGTGGGNHVLLGGPTAAESPLLRRPDLLRSLVAFWHNHPALSYIFSGLYVGPTSQAPRVDEARNDMVPELELAFRQIEGGPALPWLVDRALRNLLVDVTGNTHRAEFCIDKLFSPDTASGRRGLVELRALEMPPHPRMSLAQQLLIRALVARFWNEPYTVPLVRWHTGLHDRFMLPHFVEEDFRDVLRDLSDAGFEFDFAWFFPHVEFRFPKLGQIACRGVEIELRTAIEPWIVLGEEPREGAVARFVDASVERLQVKVRGLVESRHVIACNGWRVPLHPTGVDSEFVAGVRYQAWQAASALHPGIPVNSPLVFDLVDTWNGRSVGGCTYHVAHPGGMNYQHFPVNAFEAEARRTSRFFPYGHTPGPHTPRDGRVHPEYPLTLDLRWPGI